MIKKMTKYILEKFNFKLIKKNKKILLAKKFIKNAFHDNHEKNVLISYITNPFFYQDKSHTNLDECYIAASIFKNLNYNVDIIDYDYNKKIDFKKYKILYGQGKIFYNKDIYEYPNVKKIIYATGCNANYSNNKTILRIKDFSNKHNKILIESSRYINSETSIPRLLSNLIIILGNEFVKKTYTYYDKKNINKYKNLNAFFYKNNSIEIEEKDFVKSKNSFLWFGSSGAIHKGLDLLIDIFKERNDINLHICGLSETEKEFIDYYENELSNKSNIINHGFINIDSLEFIEIMNLCNFVIHPSVSEGGAPSVLTCMGNGGLIPIVSESSGLDIKQGYGLIIKELSKDKIENKINEALQMDIKKIKEISKIIKNETSKEYTIEKYKQNLKQIITNFIKENAL
jgi:hypothetical protein